MKQESIRITHPRPFDKVGGQFTISGSVPESWLRNTLGILDNGIFLDLLDIDGKTFMTAGLQVTPHWLSRFSHRVLFNIVFQFNQFNIGFIQQSQGRIVLKFNGNKHNEQEFFLPIVVDEFEPEGGASSEIIEKHRSVGEKVHQYREDLKHYRHELENIRASRKAKDEDLEYRHLHGPENVRIANEIAKILNEADEHLDQEKYLYSEEDEAEKKLENRYKEAIEWRGPLLRGLISTFGGFELRVYSGDHGKHFHVIHKGKKINARFSFPEIRLINYKKSESAIGSKEETKIREFCQRPEIFKQFEREFNKRHNNA